MELVFTHECDNCGTEMEHTTFMASYEEGRNKVKFPISFCGQMEFDCPNCGLGHSTDDIDVLNMVDIGVEHEMPEIPGAEEID